MDATPLRLIHELLQKDDPGALEVIYDTFGERLYRYALGLLGAAGEAEDVMQELFIKLARKRKQLLKVENLAGYLFVMTRNLALDALNARPRATVNIEDYEHLLVSAEAPPGDREDYAEVFRALFALPIEQREVVSLKCFENMSFSEIARALNISLFTAASRYRYAVGKLRRMLSKSLTM